LNEIRQQRLNNNNNTLMARLDDGKVRCISEHSSTAAVHPAIKMAEEDSQSSTAAQQQQ
jgi:hypothetical protein